SSGVQQKQEEHRRNSVPILRNIRSQRRTVREHSRNGWNGCEQFRSAAEAGGTEKEQRSNTAEHSLTAKNCQRTLAERLECLCSSSGVQQKQEEQRRNSVPILRNIRSQRRTI